MKASSASNDYTLCITVLSVFMRCVLFCGFLSQMEEGCGAKHQGLWESVGRMCVCVCACMHLFYVGSSTLSVLCKVEPQFCAPHTQTPSQWVCKAVIGPQLLLGHSYWAKGTGQDSSTLFSNKLCIYLLASTDESPQEKKQHSERKKLPGKTEREPG